MAAREHTEGLAIWFTGLSSAGKTTLARALGRELAAQGLPVEILDGDEVRRYLCHDLGFSKEDRNENIRRIAYVTRLLVEHGVIVLVSAISPYREAREAAREHIGRFVEVYVNAPLAVCEARDVKGLYRKARTGELHGMTGVDDPYEAPETPDIECHTDRDSLGESVKLLLAELKRWIPSPSAAQVTTGAAAR